VATIKLTGDGARVLTKTVNGVQRVSCSCCPQDECCPYPAQDLLDGVYSWEDLPDTIIIEEKSLNKLSPPQEFQDRLAYYLAEGSDPVGSGDEDVIAINTDGDQSTWFNYIQGGINGGGFCLLDEFWNDDFADTYTVEVFGFTPAYLSGTYSLVRRSLCVWSELIDPDDNVPSGLVLSMPQNLSPQWILEDGNQGTTGKNGAQNSPVGEYGALTVNAIIS
jgi:hypothetical protein